MFCVSTSLLLPILTSTCTCCSDTIASGLAAAAIVKCRGVSWGLNFQLDSTEHVMPCKQKLITPMMPRQDLACIDAVPGMQL